MRLVLTHKLSGVELMFMFAYVLYVNKSLNSIYSIDKPIESLQKIWTEFID